MQLTRLLLFLTAVSITSCSTTESVQSSAKSLSQTVSITYHVKRGKETEFEGVLSQAWQVYRREHLVLSGPHIIIREVENGDEPVFREFFTWVTNPVPMNVTGQVKTVWDQEQLLCEARLGHPSIESIGSIPRDVQIITLDR
jgi:hypothetical protein